MQKINHKELLDAGVHFGHLKRKWNPKMAPNIFMEKKGIHIIDLYKTGDAMEAAANAMANIAKSGRKILYIATKKQAKDVIEKNAGDVNMPFVTERWLGGMLTNFSTIRKSIKKMQSIEKLLADPNSNTSLTKRERLTLGREKAKMDKYLGGIASINRLPAAVFIVDIVHEHIALAEARKLNIPTFAMVDTNSDPTLVDFPIPSNDDAAKSIKVIADYLTGAIKDGLGERKKAKEAEAKPAPKKDEVDKAVEVAEKEEVAATAEAVKEKVEGKTEAPAKTEATAEKVEVKTDK